MTLVISLLEQSISLYISASNLFLLSRINCTALMQPEGGSCCPYVNKSLLRFSVDRRAPLIEFVYCITVAFTGIKIFLETSTFVC